MAERGTSLRRGLEVLHVLGSDVALTEGGLGVTRIASLTGHEKSLISRALQALMEYGLVERAPGNRAFRLGWGCFALAGRAGEPRLIEESRRALARLVEEVGESAHLSALRGTEVLTLLTQPSAHAIAARGWVGRTVPAYCTSSGRVLLLDFDRAALIELLGPGRLPPRGPNAPADFGELERRIHRARQVGYAVADEESEPGLVAVAAPIRDFTGRVMAAINVSGPKFRLGSCLHPTGERVRATAERLSDALGAPASGGALRLGPSGGNPARRTSPAIPPVESSRRSGGTVGLHASPNQIAVGGSECDQSQSPRSRE
ncbi:MAG: IclR family transcriptional regulator [Solirubrobacterales bacterium]|nr:IclR family transcriptional regulator [Solirubrobacterales bacterium]MBV9805698.1 IclR family transcriptional regulator [Solirubrobacterales bacterium]